MSDPVVIVAAKRTPMGAFQGILSSQSATDLGAHVLRAVLEESGLKGEDVSEVLMGCVLPAGLGQAPARQAMIKAGLPTSTGATTINKVCGSGMKAVMLGRDLIASGSADIVIAGGMESMTNAPYLLQKARGGYRMGHDQIFDHMILDGLQDAYENCSMGIYAENTVEKCGFSREDQDAFAIESAARALKAQEVGHLKKEIAPITVKNGKEEVEVSIDEPPSKVKKEKIPGLKPAFKKDGTVTAANSSSISDGAAALLLMRESEARKRGLPIRARLVAQATHSQAPEWFTLAPAWALDKVLKKSGWTKDEVDFYEINEAFAVVTLAAMKEVGLDPKRVNVHGGACALGHPIGCSGARIIVTLLNALETHNRKKGVASLCIGGGEATAVSLELVS